MRVAGETALVSNTIFAFLKQNTNVEIKKCHGIVVIETDLSEFVFTMHAVLFEQYIPSFALRARDWDVLLAPGPCITNVIATCRKNFSQWERSFLWKLRCHWLKFLRRVAKTLVIQGPALVHCDFSRIRLNPLNWIILGSGNCLSPSYFLNACLFVTTKYRAKGYKTFCNKPQWFAFAIRTKSAILLRHKCVDKGILSSTFAIRCIWFHVIFTNIWICLCLYTQHLYCMNTHYTKHNYK